MQSSTKQAVPIKHYLKALMPTQDVSYDLRRNKIDLFDTPDNSEQNDCKANSDQKMAPSSRKTRLQSMQQTTPDKAELAMAHRFYSVDIALDNEKSSQLSASAQPLTKVTELKASQESSENDNQEILSSFSISSSTSQKISSKASAVRKVSSQPSKLPKAITKVKKEQSPLGFVKKDKRPAKKCISKRQEDPNLTDIAEAVERLAGKINRTPLVESEFFGGHLKLENLQKTGAYKVRGALNKITISVQNGDRRPVIAASAGNHGRAVAYAAKQNGLKATIVVPENAPQVKVDGCLSLGATVVRHGDSFDKACAKAIQMTEELGWNFVHPFEDPAIIAGQGSMGVELMEIEPDVVVVPIGGGGLISGLGLYLQSRGVRVVGAQIVNVDNMARSIEGTDVLPELAATIGDGVRVAAVNERTKRICSGVVSEIVRVTEEEIRQTVMELAIHEKVVVEGAGAVAVAALKQVKGAKKIAIVTGGNIDPGVLAELLTAKR